MKNLSTYILEENNSDIDKLYDKLQFELSKISKEENLGDWSFGWNWKRDVGYTLKWSNDKTLTQKEYDSKLFPMQKNEFKKYLNFLIKDIKNNININGLK